MWKYTDDLDLSEITSADKPVVIFKHSNSCAISAMALNRTLSQQAQIDNSADVFLIDVKTNRATSLRIAEELNIQHESPQVIILKEGKVVHHSSHSAIRPETILSHL